MDENYNLSTNSVNVPDDDMRSKFSQLQGKQSPDSSSSSSNQSDFTFYTFSPKSSWDQAQDQSFGYVNYGHPYEEYGVIDKSTDAWEVHIVSHSSPEISITQF